ncbi:MAG TPA: protein translocase subunit SecD [Actinomycetota bacterium]|nr:protein translocase subunit SecD [Actinomycetota bacterium]
MRRTRGLWLSVLFVLALVGAGVAGFAAGVRPVLGLDLEGGVSVILSAPPGTPRDVMERALENIRERVDAFGVAEPQIFVTGTNIEVQLPGLARGRIEERPTDQWCLVDGGENHGCAPSEAEARAALEALAVEAQPAEVCLETAEGERLDCFGSRDAARAALDGISVGAPPSPAATPSPGASPAPSGNACLVGALGKVYRCFDTRKEASAALEGIAVRVTRERFCLVERAGEAAASPSPGASPTPTAPTAGPTPGAPATPLSSRYESEPLPCAESREDAEAALAALRVERFTREFCVVSSAGRTLGCRLSREQARALEQATGQERLLQLIGTTARLEQRQVLDILTPGSPTYDTTPVTCPTEVEREQPGCSFSALRDQQVVYLGEDGETKYVLGPVEVTGDAIRRATAVFATATQTNLEAGWRVDFELTGEGSRVFADVTTRLVSEPPPKNQLAIVLDRVVISAPRVQSAITGGVGQITGSFTEREAKDLATVLNAGALPVELTKQQVVTVSPTLGRESLHQGLVAGIGGLILLALYLAFYYRLLGVVTWVGMTAWAVLALALVSVLGRTAGYSLTLAGVAGLVVSLGITADSYIVFYERLKDEVRHGRSPRAAVGPAFARSFRTILTADFVTLLAAVILYLVAVSSVRGFALTLGLSTVLDVFVVYFLKRPLVFLIARSRRLTELRGFGLVSGVAAEPAPAGGGSA